MPNSPISLSHKIPHRLQQRAFQETWTSHSVTDVVICLPAANRMEQCLARTSTAFSPGAQAPPAADRSHDRLPPWAAQPFEAGWGPLPLGPGTLCPLELRSYLDQRVLGKAWVLLSSRTETESWLYLNHFKQKVDTEPLWKSSQKWRKLLFHYFACLLCAYPTTWSRHHIFSWFDLQHWAHCPALRIHPINDCRGKGNTFPTGSLNIKWDDVYKACALQMTASGYQLILIIWHKASRFSSLWLSFIHWENIYWATTMCYMDNTNVKSTVLTWKWLSCNFNTLCARYRA